MAMFNVSAAERYDAIDPIWSLPADVTARQREQTPGVFEGDIAGSILGGAKSAGTRYAIAANAGEFSPMGIHPSAMMELSRRIEMGVYGNDAGTKALEDLRVSHDAMRANLSQYLRDLRPDPKTNGMASQILFGLSDVLGTVAVGAATGNAPIVSGAVYGYSQSQVGQAEGLDPLTANVKGAIEGVSLGIAVALPIALKGGLAYRALSGAAINEATGIPTRLAVSTLLNDRGYPEMAQQYAPLDAASIITDAILGAAFGGLFGGRGDTATVPPPEVPPAVMDAALTANEHIHAEIDSAPGVPVDAASRQAHTAALDSAITSLLDGRPVDVADGLRGAEFMPRPVDPELLSIVTHELEQSGVMDALRALDQTVAEAQARGIEVDTSTGHKLTDGVVPEPDADAPIETLSNMPDAQRITAAAEREAAAANELAPGFVAAIECFLRAGA